MFFPPRIIDILQGLAFDPPVAILYYASTQGYILEPRTLVSLEMPGLQGCKMVYCRCWQHAARIRDLGLIQENVGDGGSRSLGPGLLLQLPTAMISSARFWSKARPGSVGTVAQEPQRWHKKTHFACRVFLYQPKNGGSSYIEKAPSRSGRGFFVA